MAYITVGISDIERSAAFYDQLLETLGGKRVAEMPERGVIYRVGDLTLFITKPFDGKPRSTGNGMMVGFECKDMEQIKAVYDKAIALGAQCEGEPGHRLGGFHGGYFRDLDGNKFCAYGMFEAS